MDKRSQLKQIYEQLNLSTDIVDTLTEEKVDYHLNLYIAVNQLKTADLVECLNILVDGKEDNFDKIIQDMKLESDQEAKKYQNQYEKRKIEIGNRFKKS